MFESNSLQENPKILNSLLSNHFPITCSVVNNDASFRGLGVCKFNNSLQFNKQFVKKLKTDTVTINLNLQKQFSSSDHSKQEFVEYKICKFSFLSQQIWLKQTEIYNQFLKTELKLSNKIKKHKEDFNTQNICKLELESTYARKAEGAKIRSKFEKIWKKTTFLKSKSVSARDQILNEIILPSHNS